MFFAKLINVLFINFLFISSRQFMQNKYGTRLLYSMLLASSVSYFIYFLLLSSFVSSFSSFILFSSFIYFFLPLFLHSFLQFDFFPIDIIWNSKLPLCLAWKVKMSLTSSTSSTESNEVKSGDMHVPVFSISAGNVEGNFMIFWGTEVQWLIVGITCEEVIFFSSFFFR